MTKVPKKSDSNLKSEEKLEGVEGTKSERPPHYSWSTRHLLLVVALLITVALVIVLSTAPFAAILGPSHHALAAALHGLFSFLFLVVSTVGLYLAFRLFTGRIRSFPDLQLASTTMAVLSLITIVFGNWIYIAYRAKDPKAPRTYFLENMPEVHKVFFEFKEFAALFTLPLSVAAAFILWRYGSEILDKTWTRKAVSILIALNFFYLMIAFGLGAAVAKLKGI